MHMAAAKSTPAPKAAVAKPVVAAKAAAAPAPVKPAVAVASAPAKPAVATAAKRAVDPQVRLRMIADAAYFIAEKRGFGHGHHDADWAAAEKQIDQLLARGG